MDEMTNLSNGTGERVLIVEDDPATRTGLAELVQNWGFQTDEAADGEEAVTLDREVGGTPGQLRRTLCEVDADAGETHTETDLRGVRTAGGAGRRARAVQLLTQQVLEENAAALVSGRVDVGDVVTDDVHESLV